MLPARGPAGTTPGHSLSRWPDSTRDHLPDPWQCGGSTPSSDCNARRAEPPNGKSDRLDQGELCEAATGGRSRGNRGHGRIHAAPSFPGADRHESSSVSETVSVAGSAGTHAHGWSGRRKCGLRGRIRKRQPIQPRIQPFLRPATDAGYSDPSLAKRSAVGVGQQWVKTLSGRDSFREAPLKSGYRNVAVPGRSAIRKQSTWERSRHVGPWRTAASNRCTSDSSSLVAQRLLSLRRRWIRERPSLSTAESFAGTVS